MASIRIAVELYAQDRTGILDDIPSLTDGIHRESDVLSYGEPVGPACNLLYVATVDEELLDGLSEAEVFRLAMDAAEAV